MSRYRLITAALAVVCSMSWSPMARAVEVDLVVGIRGATFMPFDRDGETGNGYGGTVGVNISSESDIVRFRVLAGLGGVLPAARPAGHFATVWLEGQWHPLAQFLSALEVPLSPYAVLGLCVATKDGFDSANDPADSVRWVPGAPQVMAMGGLGLALGEFDGFYVAADGRFYNGAYGGFIVSAGYAF